MLFLRNRVFSSSRLLGSILDTLGLPFKSLLAPKMAETCLGNPLGPAKSRSRALFFGPRAVQERSKRSPRPPKKLRILLQTRQKAPKTAARYPRIFKRMHISIGFIICLKISFYLFYVWVLLFLFSCLSVFSVSCLFFVAFLLVVV